RGAAVLDEGEPLAGAVVLVVAGAVAGELGDEEVALLEQGEVVLGVPLAVGARRDELVHVVEALVVAHVGDDPTVVRDDDVGALVLEATERGELAGGAFGVEGVD